MINNILNNIDLDIYTLSENLDINHKIIRSFLNENKLQCSLRKKTRSIDTYTSPSEEVLLSPLSIITHQIYLCEGWHTNKTDTLSFFNQDIHLIKIFCQCLIDVYNYKNIIPISFVYNKNDVNSNLMVDQLMKNFTNPNIYNIYFTHDSTRKNPIIKVKTGGKNLAFLFIENAYKILHSTS